MKKVKNQNDKSMKYVESKILRDETINNVSYDFLDKMKVVPYLTNDMVISTSQAANYYECGLEAIKTIINEPNLSPKEKFITAKTINILINWSLNESKRKYI